jgi:DNA gyrase subunit B
VGISLVRMVSEYFFVKTSNKNQQYSKLFTPDEKFIRLVKSFKFKDDIEEKVFLHFDEQGNMNNCSYLDKKQLAKCRKLMRQNMMAEKITSARSKHGTFVEFRLNSKYFSDLSVKFDLKLIRQYIQDLAMTNPGLTIIFKYKNKEETYKFKKGLEEIFINSNMEYYKINYKNKKSKNQIDLNAYIVMGQNKTLTWVNSNFASLGGSPIEYLENRICDEVRKKASITSLEKKLKTPATRNDVRNCFHMYLDFRLINPRFKSQDKSYLINDLNEDLRNAVDRYLDKLLRKTDLISEIKAQMERRTHMKALTEAQKGLRRAKRENIPKYIPPTTNNTFEERMLFIAEGDSAIAGLRPARNPEIHGLFPLKGKPLNVNGMSLAKAMANEEIKNIVAIIGLPINSKVRSISELKYNKVSIITDADFDGYAIRSLILSFFYEYWPELFEMGFINISTAPLYEVDVQDNKGKQTIFCIDDAEYQKLERSLKKSSGKIIRKKRNKGLGESSIDALRYAVDECMIEIKLDQKKRAGKIQNLWFNKQNADERRKAISEYSGTIYDEN